MEWYHVYRSLNTASAIYIINVCSYFYFIGHIFLLLCNNPLFQKQHSPKLIANRRAANHCTQTPSHINGPKDT